MKTILIPKLHLQKKTLPQWLTYYIFIMPFAFGLLEDLMGLPGAIRYTVDVAWCALVLLALRKQWVRFDRKLLPLVCLTGLWLLYTLTVYLFRFQSPAYYLWGLRNNFRVYVAFYAYAAFLDEDDVAKGLKLMDNLFWINVAVSLFQFLVLGYRQDYLGGIFGVEKGSNAYSVIFFSIVITKSILSMMNGREKLSMCLLRCGATLIIAAFAELYAFFAFFLLILVMAAVFTRFSWKKCLLFFAMALALPMCSMILMELFGKGSRLSLEVLLKRLLATNYATKEDLGRLSAVPTIARTILTELPEKLFGLGLGNCDTSSFAICNTPFYRSHAKLHYTWLMSAFVFLETGYLGLLLYVSFFLICFVLAVRKLKRGGNMLYCQMTAVMSVLCIVLTVYNASLRSEAGYMAYFVLAMMFAKPRQNAGENHRGRSI